MVVDRESARLVVRRDTTNQRPCCEWGAHADSSKALLCGFFVSLLPLRSAPRQKREPRPRPLEFVQQQCINKQAREQINKSARSSVTAALHESKQNTTTVRVGVVGSSSHNKATTSYYCPNSGHESRRWEGWAASFSLDHLTLFAFLLLLCEKTTTLATMMMKLSSLLLLSIVLAIFPGRCLAQENPVCCLCGGPEPCPDISNPDAIIQVPDDTDVQEHLTPGLKEARCSLFKDFLELQTLLPPEVSCIKLVVVLHLNKMHRVFNT